MSSETNAMESNSTSDAASNGVRLPLVAIDGVLGSGKTTVAQRLATHLGLQYLDTGAMYRCVGLACAWAKIELSDVAAVTAIAKTAVIDVRSDADGAQQVRLNGDDVTTEIRTPEAARDASTVATIAGVRSALVAQQQMWGKTHLGGVLEGRDIATVVFPQAPVKIFLTASVEERARRRHGEQSDRTLAEVVADLAWRDEQDSTRAADPLRIADKAIVVDTTAMTLDEVVDRCVAIAKERLADAKILLPARAMGTVALEDLGMNADASSLSRTSTASSEGGGGEKAKSAAISTAASETAARSVSSVAQYQATRIEKILWWLVRFLVLGFSKLYFRVTYEGLENVPKSGAYLVSPTHRSNVDSFVVLGLTKRRIRFLAKEEMWKLSFVHPLWDALGGIKVERGSTDRESMKLCMAALASGEPLAAYPEGTRREGPVVEGLFDGPAYMALKAGVPIVPMGIGGSALAMGRGDKFPKPKHIHVVIGKPLNSPPSNETGRRHIRALTAELAGSLQNLLEEAQQKAKLRPKP